MRKVIRALIKTMRTRQYTKNLIIFAAIIFSQNMFNYSMLIKTIFAFAIFCLLSSSVYIINDICDFEEDKKFPWLSRRPIVSGELRVMYARIGAILIAIISLASACYLNISFGLIALAYFLLGISYSLFLKKVVILNILVVAFGFVLRVVAGGVVINVEPSSWLLICTFFLALFLAVCKQRYKIKALTTNTDKNKEVRYGYNVKFLDQLVAVVTVAVTVSYILYTTSAETISRFKTTNLKFTALFVLYGIFRYLYLVYQRHVGGMPEEILLTDKPLLISIIL